MVSNMNLFNKILSIFKKNNNVKALKEGQSLSENNVKPTNGFRENIRVNQVNPKRPVGTMTSVGDGLGIDTKMGW